VPGAEIADFIEEQRSSARRPEQARMVPVRAREGSLAVTEELGLHEVGGDRTTVHGDELARPTGEEMERPGEELLAGPALALEEHGDAAGGHSFQAPEHRLQGGRERPEPGRAYRQIFALQQGRFAPVVRRVKGEEGAAHLKHRPVVEELLLDAFRVDEGSVPGPGIPHQPSVVLLPEVRMLRGHGRIGQLDLQHSVVELGLAFRSTSQEDTVHVVEEIAGWSCERPLGLDLEEETRPGPYGPPSRPLSQRPRIAPRRHPPTYSALRSHRHLCHGTGPCIGRRAFGPE
jgi:hypothetical protein